MLGSLGYAGRHDGQEVVDELRSRAAPLVTVGQTAEAGNGGLGLEELGALLAGLAGDVLEACDRLTADEEASAPGKLEAVR